MCTLLLMVKVNMMRSLWSTLMMMPVALGVAAPGSAAMAAEPIPQWIKMPILTLEQKAAGVFPGGEGAQWPRGPIAVSPADPSFLLLPIDVGGLYRSLDSGAHWGITMTGWNARGANGFAIDPSNAGRAIGIAANSLNWKPEWGKSPHGLYLTTDKAASWKQVMETAEGFDGRLAYDPTSYYAAKGSCTRIYYLSADHGLFHSLDGGETWSPVENAPAPGRLPGGDWSTGFSSMPALAVDGRSGVVYLAGQNGMFRSEDHASTWQQMRKQATYGFHVSADGSLYSTDPLQIQRSTDGGATWQLLPAKGIDVGPGQRVQNLVVSPADANRILCWTSGANFVWPRYYSHDGGETFGRVITERDGAPLPMNGRQGYFTWDPADPNIAYCIGGDWAVKSTDGGKTFHWSNNGYNGVMAGGSFAFSVHHPDHVLITFQDYNGAFTTDGGATWNYRDISGLGWGGHEYSAYALNPQVMWCGDAEGWGTPRRLRITRDGGKTWTLEKGADGKPLELGKWDASHGDPADGNVGFAGSLRTADGGKTWSRMADCQGVYTYDPKTLELYGKNDRTIVKSSDHGATWTPVAEASDEIHDIAVDPQRNALLVASGDRLKVWQDGRWTTVNTPADQYGHIRVSTVAIDPREPSIIYVGGPRNTYASHAAVCRSTDAGKTWTNLTVNVPLKDGIEGGPHEVSFIRVHPVTREAWVAGQCFGLWRIVAPAKERGK